MGATHHVVLPFKYSGGVGFDRILPLNLWSIIIGFGTWSPGRTNVGPQVDAVGNRCDANSILGWFTNPIGGISEHPVEKIYFSSLWTCNPWTFFFRLGSLCARLYCTKSIAHYCYCFSRLLISGLFFSGNWLCYLECYWLRIPINLITLNMSWGDLFSEYGWGGICIVFL